MAGPGSLRDPAVDGALHRMPALAAALEGLGPCADAPADDPPGHWFLLPASSLIHASVLAGPLAPPLGRPAVPAESPQGTAPVALRPATPSAPLCPAAPDDDLAAGPPASPELARARRA